jgi:hypothetical protein
MSEVKYPLYPQITMELDVEEASDKMLAKVKEAIAKVAGQEVADQFELKAVASNWDHMCEVIEDYIAVTWITSAVEEPEEDSSGGEELEEDEPELDDEDEEEWDDSYNHDEEDE